MEYREIRTVFISCDADDVGIDTSHWAIDGTRSIKWMLNFSRSQYWLIFQFEKNNYGSYDVVSTCVNNTPLQYSLSEWRVFQTALSFKTIFQTVFGNCLSKLIFLFITTFSKLPASPVCKKGALSFCDNLSQEFQLRRQRAEATQDTH